MAGKNRPQNRRGGNKPSNRGSFAPRPQPQRIKAKGTTHKAPGAGTSGGNCCPMVAAIRSARRGRYRLARRYALMSLRLIAAKMA